MEGMGMAPFSINRKVFISFHQKDRNEVDDFIEKWAKREDAFIPKALGTLITMIL